MKRILILILGGAVLCFSGIKIFTDRTEAYTGERITISIETDRPEGSHPDLEALKASPGPDFELVDSGTEKQELKDGRIYETFVNRYAVFAEPGEHYLGPLKFSYVNGDSSVAQFSDSIRINVKSVIRDRYVTAVDSAGNERKIPMDSLSTVLPIKDIGSYSLSLREKWYIAGLAVSVLLLVLILIFMSKRKKKAAGIVTVKPEKKTPAHITALERLEALRLKKYIDKGEYKEFASELSLIFRNFLEDRFGFPAAEIPTSELKEEVRKRVDEMRIIEEMDKLLEVTDFVKYAKFLPLEAELKSFLDFAFEAVDGLKEENGSGGKDV